jgi:hypothetical protein
MMMLCALVGFAAPRIAAADEPPGAAPPAAAPAAAAPAAAAPAAAAPASAGPATAAPAAGDTRSSHSTAQSEAGEPRAATSADLPAASTAGAAAPAAPAPAGTGSPKGPRTPRAATAAGAGAGAGQKSTAADRLELGTATVTGDREQPKVMYIVPWKKSDIGDLSGKPMNSLLDEALAPVDRDEFKRQVVYYQAVQADASQNGASKARAQGEK